METRQASSDCTLIEQAILNRYPLILVECEEGDDSHRVYLRLTPNSAGKELKLTMQDLLDESWQEAVDSAVRELRAM